MCGSHHFAILFWFLAESLRRLQWCACDCASTRQFAPECVEPVCCERELCCLNSFFGSLLSHSFFFLVLCWKCGLLGPSVALGVATPCVEMAKLRGPHSERSSLRRRPRDETPSCPALHSLTHEIHSLFLQSSRHRGVRAQGIEKGQGGEPSRELCLRLRRSLEVLTKRSSPRRGPHRSNKTNTPVKRAPNAGREILRWPSRPEPPSQPQT